MRIVYYSIQFASYQKKFWYHQDDPESFCKKIPMRNIGVKTLPFNALVSGEQVVNTTANLMFTADFQRTQGVFYRTNRFITCTAFSGQAEIQDPAVRNLWEDRGLGSNIVLSTYPLVGLIPCFSRGEIVQTTENVLLKGWFLTAEEMRCFKTSEFSNEWINLGKALKEDILRGFPHQKIKNICKDNYKISRKLQTPDLLNNTLIYSHSLKTYYDKINLESFQLDRDDHNFFKFLRENLIISSRKFNNFFEKI